MSARQDRRDKIASRAVQIGFVVALIGLWYFGTAYWGISRILLPNPVNVWHELKDVIGSGEFLPDLRVTLTELAVAFAISCTAGVTLGYLISRSPYLIKVFEPLLAGFYSVPIILFLPLYVLFFGLGPGSKIALGTTISFFPDRAQHHRGLRLCREDLHHRRALDGRLRLSRCSATCCCRPPCP